MLDEDVGGAWTSQKGGRLLEMREMTMLDGDVEDVGDW